MFNSSISSAVCNAQVRGSRDKFNVVAFHIRLVEDFNEVVHPLTQNRFGPFNCPVLRAIPSGILSAPCSPQNVCDRSRTTFWMPAKLTSSTPVASPLNPPHGPRRALQTPRRALLHHELPHASIILCHALSMRLSPLHPVAAG